MRTPTRRAALGAALVLAAACDRPAESPASPDAPPAAAQRARVGAGVLDAVRRGDAHLVVMLRDPVESRARGGAADVDDLRRRVAAASEPTLRRAAARGVRVRRTLQTVPAFSAVVSGEAALAALASDPAVEMVDLDAGGTGHLAASVPFIRAQQRHAAGNTGEGVTVAIMDTGIDTDHPDLADDVAFQACFGNRTGPVGDGIGFCPGGGDRRVGPGAAEDDAGHGTHVAGIVTSRGVVAARGVAPDANIAAFKVMDACSFAGCFYSAFEIVAAFDYVIANNAALGVKVINLSLGTGARFPGACDGAAAFTAAGAAAVNTLRAMGVVTVASSGNNGDVTNMPWPACLSNVISVGATDNAGNVAGFSNSNATTDVFAPGVGIVSNSRFGGLAVASGTSMASPHVAGCAALLVQSGDATTPGAIEARLETSAFGVVRNGIAFPRLDCKRDARPPTAFAGGPYAGGEGVPIAFAGSATDPQGEAIVSYAWSFGDGTLGAGPAPAKTYVDNGTYTATLTVTSATGLTATSTALVTVSNAAPVIRTLLLDPAFLNRAPVGASFPIAFRWRDRGAADGPWTWRMAWGDGTESTGAAATQADIALSHEYGAPGSYTARFTIRDKDGAATSRSVPITAVAAP